MKECVYVIYVGPHGERSWMRVPAYLLVPDFGSRCGQCGHPIDEGGHCSGCRKDHNPVPQHLH